MRSAARPAAAAPNPHDITWTTAMLHCTLLVMAVTGLPPKADLQFEVVRTKILACGLGAFFSEAEPQTAFGDDSPPVW